jgi:hypothetical protein
MKFIRLLFTASAIAVGLSACATGQRMGEIHEGMTKNDVLATLGNPDGFQRVGEDEALRYSDRLISGWSWNRTDYTVILHEGRVSAYGPGFVRQERTGVLILVLVR